MTEQRPTTERRLTDEEWSKIHSALRQYDHVSSFQDLNRKVGHIVKKRRDEPASER